MSDIWEGSDIVMRGTASVRWPDGHPNAAPVLGTGENGTAPDTNITVPEDNATLPAEPKESEA